MNEVFENPLMLSGRSLVDISGSGAFAFAAANVFMLTMLIPMQKEQTAIFLKKDFMLHLKPALPGCFFSG